MKKSSSCKEISQEGLENYLKYSQTNGQIPQIRIEKLDDFFDKLKEHMKKYNSINEIYYLSKNYHKAKDNNSLDAKFNIDEIMKERNFLLTEFTNDEAGNSVIQNKNLSTPKALEGNMDFNNSDFSIELAQTEENENKGNRYNGFETFNDNKYSFDIESKNNQKLDINNISMKKSNLETLNNSSKSTLYSAVSKTNNIDNKLISSKNTNENKSLEKKEIKKSETSTYKKNSYNPGNSLRLSKNVKSSSLPKLNNLPNSKNTKIIQKSNSVVKIIQKSNSVVKMKPSISSKTRNGSISCRNFNEKESPLYSKDFDYEKILLDLKLSFGENFENFEENSKYNI